MTDKVAMRDDEGIRVNLKPRRLYYCKKCKQKGITTAFTIKFLDKVCEHKTVQPECKKYCCRCCPNKVREE